jgi:TetR/AcrR family transcriptional repressor of nem operon
VMAESGASKSQLYHYFADKEALVLDVVALQTERVFKAQQPHLQALDSLAAFRKWRDAVVDLQKGKHPRGCPIGTLASELANDFEGARCALAGSFATWGGHIESGLRKMQERGELAASADPHAVAVAILCAVQGGLLLAKTMRTSRPLELAFEMAIDHVAQQMTNRRHRA